MNLAMRGVLQNIATELVEDIKEIQNVTELERIAFKLEEKQIEVDALASQVESLKRALKKKEPLTEDQIRQERSRVIDDVRKDFLTWASSFGRAATACAISGGFGFNESIPIPADMIDGLDADEEALSLLIRVEFRVAQWGNYAFDHRCDCQECLRNTAAAQAIARRWFEAHKGEEHLS